MLLRAVFFHLSNSFGNDFVDLEEIAIYDQDFEQKTVKMKYAKRNIYIFSLLNKSRLFERIYFKVYYRVGRKHCDAEYNQILQKTTNILS